MFAVADECGYACEIQYYGDCFCLKAMETVMVRVRGIRRRTASGHYVAEIVVVVLVVPLFLLIFLYKLVRQGPAAMSHS